MLVTARGALSACAALGLASFLISSPANAGKLADAGRAARTPPSSSSSRSSSSSSSCDVHSSRDDDGTGAAIAILILTSPWTLPNMALEPTDRGAPTFEDYPYSRGSNGLLRYPASQPAESGEEPPVRDASTDDETPVSKKTVLGQIRAEGSYILGGVYRGGLGARLMMPFRLELDGTFYALAEPLGDGNVDQATFADAHLGVRFAESEHVQFHTGFGYEQYADQRSTEPGFDFFYGFEAELGARLVLAAGVDAGAVGHAFVGQARASLGVMIGRFEIYAGYDHVSIGGVALGGPTAGVQAWL